MDFQNDLTKLLKQKMQKENIYIPTDWDNFQICMSYFEVSHRCFDSSVPYKVLYSNELIKKLPYLPIEDQKAIKDIESRLEHCKSLTTYMSKDITTVSTKKSDFFLKNWNIYHLHLEERIPPKVFTKENLLFFQPKGKVVHFIDVKTHPRGKGWANIDLIKIVYNNWPWLLRPIKGIKSVDNLTENEIYQLNKKAVYMINLDKQVFIPTNLGVASSGNSIMAIKTTQTIFNALKESEQWLKDNEEVIKKKISKDLGVNVNRTLDYELIIESNFYVAREKNSNAEIKLFEFN